MGCSSSALRIISRDWTLAFPPDPVGLIESSEFASICHIIGLVDEAALLR